MNHTHGEIRPSVDCDRLSNLPDDLIHKIFSCVDTTQAIEASALSSRWRYTWTSMPSLTFSCKDPHTFTKFTKFVKHVLSHRNNQIELSYVKLTFHDKDSQAFVKRVAKRVLNYRPSHRVQQLDITCASTESIEAPLVFLSSQCLKQLTLTGFIYTPAAYELLALTTLNLQDVTLREENSGKCGGLFSNCANLENLTLNRCRMDRYKYKPLNISHPRLLNLTLEDGYDGCNVVTPKLKSLIVRHLQGIVVVSAPNLVSLHYTNRYHPLQFSGELLHLEKANICVCNHEYYRKEKGREVLCIIQQLTSVKDLSLNTETMQFLFSYVELISHQPSPFTNLKKLYVYPHYVDLEKHTQPIVTLSAEVLNYFLKGSSSPTYTFRSHEEERDLRNVKLAQKLMRELQVLLDDWKMDSKTITAHIEQADKEAQSDTEMNSHFRKRMTRINEHFKKGHKYTDLAIPLLDKIEGVMRRLPTSDRTKVQATFSILCAEAEPIMNNLMDRMKI